jgi:hypothetical protein
VTRWLPQVRAMHPYPNVRLAARTEAGARCGSSTRRDPCGGPPGRAVPTATREACQTVVEVHQEIARLLSDPGTGGVGGDAQEVDATGGVLHNEQHIEPVQQHCVDAEEVGGENAVCLGGQELPPGGAAAALRCICAGDTPKRPQL